MDRKEIMKHIVRNTSDAQIKWEFYHEIIYSQLKVCSLWTDSYDKTNLVEAEEWFAELKQQLEIAGFTCVDIISNDNSNKYIYRLTGTDAYIKLDKSIYNSRCHNGQKVCSIYMAIYLDQFKGKDLSYSNGENNAGFDIGDQKDAVSLAVSFIRNIPQYEKQWKEFDIAAIHKELEQKRTRLDSLIKALIRNAELPYDIQEYKWGYDVYFQLPGGWYMRTEISAEMDLDRLPELEQFIRNTASSCSRLGDLYFKIRTEQENDEDYIYDDDYVWHEPDTENL